MNRTHGDICDLSTGTVGTSSALALASGSGRVAVSVKNTHGSQTLTVGPASTVSTTEGTRFIGGTLAAGASLTISDYIGPIYVIGSGASTTYTLQVIRKGTRAD